MNYLILAGAAWLLMVASASFASGGTPGGPSPEQDQSSAGAVRLGQSDTGRPARLALGQILIVTLDANPSTGYSWQVIDFDQKLLEQDGQPTFDLPPQSLPPMAGGGGSQTFRFRAKGVGNTLLHLVYQRPWETSAAPTDDSTFTLSITIR